MVDRTRWRVICAFVLMGSGVILAQIILLRELMVVFSGNELATGVMLAAWLLWTAIGSAVLGVFADRIKEKPLFFASVQLVTAFLLPFSFLLVRYLRPLLGVPPGEIASLAQMLLGIFSLLIPFCLLSGFLFALGCSLLGGIVGKNSRSVGKVYVYEALGAGIGGMAFSYLLIHIFNPWEVVLLGAALLSLSSFLINQNVRAVAILLMCLSIGSLALFGARLNLISQGWPWRGYQLMASKDTIYGTITVISDGPQVSFFENGVWTFTHPDPQTAEEASHFALLEHPRPRDVLLVGGGVGGLIDEVLKHPTLRHVDYVELDPHLISMGKKYLPLQAALSLDDPRVEIIPADGRRFIQEAKKKYDVIILHLPGPTTAQFNRFYTREFFAAAAKILRKGGIFSLSVHSSENIIGPTLAQFLSSLYWTLRDVFPEVVVLPGPSARFLAAMTVSTLTSDPQILSRRALQRDLKVQYVRDYYLRFNFSPERINYLRSILEQGKGVVINRDLRPICYFYDIILWSAQHTPFLKHGFVRLAGTRGEWIIFLLTAFTLIILWRSKRSSSLSVVWAVAIMGFSQIALEVILILAFQIIYGYLYYKIGVIITAFMIGLALGGWLTTSLMARITRPLRLLLAVQAGVALYAVGILLLIQGLNENAFHPSVAGAIENVFPFLTLVAGVLGGVHFPLANAIYLGERKEVGRIGGFTYGIDLAGSAAGALMISVFLVPIAGVAKSIFLIVALNLSAILCLGVRVFFQGKR